MALRIIKEVNRTEGLLPAASQDIIQGHPLVLATASTVKLVDDVLDKVLGLAAEDVVQNPIAPTSGQVVGEGFDYTDFARGGKVSAFTNGGIFELFDDGRGAPYEINDTYVLNRPVFASQSNGLITSVGTGSRQEIGSVVDFEGSPVTRLRIKLTV